MEIERLLNWANLIFFVYSVDSLSSISYVEGLMCKARQNLDSKCLEYEDSPRRRRQDPPIFYILGNKCDLHTCESKNVKTFNYRRGRRISKVYSAEFNEISARDDQITLFFAFNRGIDL